MEISIRKATAADLDGIETVYDHIHTAQEQGGTYTGWVRGVYPTRATAEEALHRGDLFVETADGAVVGTAIFNQTQAEVYRQADWQYDLPDPAVMVLHTLVIDPQAKGHGLGRAMVEAYENYARAQGCTGLRMDTNERNVSARRFYQKLGYREAGIFPCLFNGISGVKLVMLEKKL